MKKKEPTQNNLYNAEQFMLTIIIAYTRVQDKKKETTTTFPIQINKYKRCIQTIKVINNRKKSYRTFVKHPCQ